MPSPLENKYRVISASFLDSARGRVWRDRLDDDLGEAVDVLVFGLGNDLAVPPRELDGDGVGELLEVLLPARLTGREAYGDALPDLLEDFLVSMAEEVGVASTFEWINAVDRHREAYARALADQDRPRLAAPSRTPDRRPGAKIGRNDPCPCGSGRKYKRCCLGR